MARRPSLEETVNGKTQKWVLGTLTFSHFAQHFYAGAPVIFQNIRTDLGLRFVDIGIMTGTSNTIAGSLQLTYSIAGRRLPKRTLLGSASLAISLGCLLMGLADRFLGLLLGSAITGIGLAGIHPTSTSIIAQKLGRKSYVRALSIFYGLGYVGNIISPLLLSTIALSTSWRWSFFFLALIPLTAGLSVLYYLREEPAGDKSLLASSRNLWSDIKSSIRIRGAKLVLVAQGFIEGGTGLGVILTWIPLFLRDATKGLGLGIFETALISTLSTAGGVIGTIIVGRVADRFGYLRTVMICVGSTILAVCLLTIYSSFSPILIPHLFIIGVTTFSIPTLLQSHLTAISTDSQRDILLGLYFTFGFGVSSLWSTIMGNFVDWYSFNALWAFMSTLGFVALFMLFSAYRNLTQSARAQE